MFYVDPYTTDFSTNVVIGDYQIEAGAKTATIRAGLDTEGEVDLLYFGTNGGFSTGFPPGTPPLRQPTRLSWRAPQGEVTSGGLALFTFTVPTTLYFAQFGNGSGLASDIVVVKSFPD